MRVTAVAESMVRGGHPWVFSNSVREQNRPGEAGEFAVIFDRQDKFLAIGLFDPESPIRVRILHTGKPCAIDAVWWRTRAEVAIAQRNGLFDSATTGYRLINGESDGWPGLVLDRYDDTLVLKIYTAAWLPRVQKTADLLSGKSRLVLRLSRNIQEQAARVGFQDGQILRGAPLDGTVTFLENGLRFEADVLRGQKTGFFLDQRENRRKAGALSGGRRVLNLFSYTGGFSLYAAAGGADSVLSLDISEHALSGARRNFALNQNHPAVTRCQHEIVQADAFKWLAAKPNQEFDMIVLDPPSLAKRESERAAAIGAYGKLIEGALLRLAPKGVLIAASCSAHVSADDFFALTRKLTPDLDEMEATRHPADHPATFPEAEYLKCIYLRRRG
ncbi:MAG TPA: class I SAM-dependent methyltransferase [Verrucomicrobiae bacterium]|nr:class I SAM-dependent methyltransferase [Verrucomicrobiae bacterium]